jgi:hypothetical protein
MSIWSGAAIWRFVQGANGEVYFLSTTGAKNGTYGFQYTAYAFPEVGMAYLTVTRQFGDLGPAEIHYATADGTAIAGTDYTAVSGTLLWLNGDVTAKQIIVPLIRTSAIVDSEFTVNLTNIYPFTFPISPAVATVTIMRQGNGELDLVGSAYQVQDPNTGTVNLIVQVQRFNAFKGAGGCSYHTTDGSAIAGTDYTATSGTLNWTDGQGGSQNISIPILGRAGNQGSRSFTVTIDTPTGVLVIGATNVATVTIVEGTPASNPVAGGSIPQWLFTDILGERSSGGSELVYGSTIVDPSWTPQWRNNIQFASMLGQKIGSVIGFGPGPDPTNNDPVFIPTPNNIGRRRMMNYKERV